MLFSFIQISVILLGMNASKETMRLEAIKHRNRIDPGSENPDEAASLFFETVKPSKDTVVAVYWPKGREFPPTAIIERLLSEGILCALPVVKSDTKVLDFVAWNEDIELTAGPFGIMQPVINDETVWIEPDIIIIPFLAFDRKGHRLGYGGGYYDATIQTLKKKKPDIVTVGLGYAQQAVLFTLPSEEHDQTLDWVITPQQAHYFGP